MRLNELKPKPGATRRRKRVGCGPGSGHGKTSTRGHKGYGSRSGAHVKRGFEGGQMPLARRLPKRGFVNLFKQRFEIVNVGQLSKLEANTVVTPEFLKERGIIKGRARVKVLSDGELSVPLTVKAHGFSKRALEKIAKANGQTEIIP